MIEYKVMNDNVQLSGLGGVGFMKAIIWLLGTQLHYGNWNFSKDCIIMMTTATSTTMTWALNWWGIWLCASALEGGVTNNVVGDDKLWFLIYQKEWKKGQTGYNIINNLF